MLRMRLMVYDGRQIFIGPYWHGEKSYINQDDIFFNLGNPPQWTFPLPNNIDTVVRFNLFDGLFAINDRTCIGAVAAIKEAGFKIPEDVAVVGFNDEPTVQYLNPPLTTIRQPAFEMGKEVANLFLKERNKSNLNTAPIKIVLETELIVRRST